MNYDEKLMLRLTKAEREIERLKVHGAHKAGEYADTYFDDLLFPLVGQKMESPSAHITYAAGGSSVTLAKTCVYPDDYVTMNLQMPHCWKIGSLIYPHLHWRQSAAVMPNLLIDWRWQVNGAIALVPYYLIPHSANAFTWSTGTLNQITKFESIEPPTGAGLSDLLQIRLYRDVGNASSEFTGGAEVDNDVQDNVNAYSFDVHFEIDSAGSNTEYTK
jgi:hypothetical protein